MYICKREIQMLFTDPKGVNGRKAKERMKQKFKMGLRREYD
jgi:hypothetical protein